MKETVSLAIAGSGGAGVMTVGAALLQAAARAGYYGLFTRLAGAQVRGGEAAALLTLGVEPVLSPPDAYDALVAIDWGHVDRFAGSIPLAAGSLILRDPKQGDVPAPMAATGAALVDIPFAFLAKVPGGKANMVALGALGMLLGLPAAMVDAVAVEKLAGKGDKALDGARVCVLAGRASGAALAITALHLAPARALGRARWLISGDQALALGALRGGVRFAAGYPITPATDVVEWLAPVMEGLGGAFVQAEDELAAINMCLGSSYGGIPAMTVTSGPGLSLMVETIGLAVAAEIPVVVIDVQRCGPSTGIASKSEQSDLNLALHGAHGDAPRIVLAPVSAEDGLPTTQWAVELSEQLQCPVLLLSDQQMGQAELVMDVPAPSASGIHRLFPPVPAPAPYKRYALTESGVSPVSLPGMKGMAWIGESLTHTEASAASSAAKDHVAQIEKRSRKLTTHDFGGRWGEVEGEGELAVIAWGSTVGAAREAVRRCAADGLRIRLVALRLIAPFPARDFSRALAGVTRALVIEQNHSGQLYRHLRSEFDGPAQLRSWSRPGPEPFRPAELHRHIVEWEAA